MSRKWGEWVYKNNYTLTSKEGKGYEIDLETITSSGEMLDWIFQVQQKGWATPKLMHDLLAAFQDLLDPQANYCGSGSNKKVSEKKVREIIEKNLSKRRI